MRTSVLQKAAAAAAVLSTGLLPGLFDVPQAQAAPPPSAMVTYSHATYSHATKVATFSFASLGSAPGGSGAAQAPPHQPMNRTLRHTTAAQVPRVAGTPVASGTGGSTGFNGLDDVQQVNAGTGAYAGSQFDVAPPDQGLCVGNGAVVESVNLAMRVYSTAGIPVTAAVPLNQFFGAAPETTAGASPFGPFLSDPKCYYDPATSRWFMTLLQFSVDPSTGAFGNTALQYVAVSATGDPAGTWMIYSFPTTDDGTAGTPSDPGCPCFGDQPLLGADANGVYITTNEYSISGPAYNGAQIYAMSKLGLETGTNTTVTHLQPGLDPAVTAALGGVAFSVQPATSPTVSDLQTAANGTEYFQSALDFGAAPALGTRADRIAVWSLTDTASLGTATPDLALRVVVLGSEEYTQPPNSAQAPGTLVINKHLPLIDTNDDRMNQAVYADGQLWSGLNTAVETPQGPTLSGVAWFVTNPATTTGDLSATMAGQGYLAVNGQDVMYPSIGVTHAGRAVMAFTLAGPGYHPSAAWAPVSTSGVGPIYVAAAGRNADDDFTSVKAYGGSGSGRWGDYSAAVADPSGTVWMAAEYISGLERTPFADWSTFVSHVTP